MGAIWEPLLLGLARYNLWDDHTALKLFSGLLFPRRRWTEPIRHVVIYRVGNIGDTVVAIPAMAAVRSAFPDAKITLLTSAGQPDLPGAADVLSAFPGLVDKIVSYYPAELRSWTGFASLKTRLQTQDHTSQQPQSIDAWVSLPVTMQGIFRGYREVLLARLFGSRRATGFTVLLPEFFKRTYIKHHTLPRTSDWLLTLVQTGLQGWDIQTPPPATPRPNDPHASAADALSYFQSPQPEMLNQLGLKPDAPLLVVNAGAKLAIKRWPVSAFRAVLTQVLNEIPSVQIVLLGNAQEQSLNADIAHDLPGQIVNLAGQLSLAQTWSILHQATAVLSNDTGAMHMAGLLHKPVFTPMSGQYPAPLWHPPGPKINPEIQIFEHPVPCAPCFKSECPLPQQLCLTEINPSRLSDALCAGLKIHSAS